MTGYQRRGFFKGALAALGLGAAPAVEAQQEARPARGAAASAILPAYCRAQNYKSLKESSHDPTGGNHDFWTIKAGDTKVIFNQQGPGAITHIWFTIAARTVYHLKELVLRAYWDGSEKPSIETPIGDFFGLNLGDYVHFESQYIACSPGKSLNCYFVMPYQKSARLTVTNEGAADVGSFYSNIDFAGMPQLPSDALYFHAQYRQATPHAAVAPVNGQTPNNPDGKKNHVYCETHGRGHLMGVTLGVVQNAENWMGEGDDMIFVDDEALPVIIGTGSEDYFLGSWNFGGRENAKPFSPSSIRCAADSEPRADRRPLLLLSLPWRQPGDVHEVPEAHHGARPRQRPGRQFLQLFVLVPGQAGDGFSSAAGGQRSHSQR